MKRSGSAVWKGGLRDGNGAISTDSGVLSDTQYSFTTRFEQGKGTNPGSGCPVSKVLNAQITMEARLEG